VVVFEVGIKISPIEKKLGRETVKIEVSEWEMNSLLNLLSQRNKTLYTRIVKELIDEAKKEGFEMMMATGKVKVECPHCKGEVEI
jgi:hypothetical protein